MSAPAKDLTCPFKGIGGAKQMAAMHIGRCAIRAWLLKAVQKA